MLTLRFRIESSIRMVLILGILFNAIIPAAASAATPTNSNQKTEVGSPPSQPQYNQQPVYFSPTFTPPQQDTSPQPDTPPSPVPPKASVEFTAIADPAVVPADGRVTITVTIGNHSGQRLTGLAFSDRLETGMEFDNSTAPSSILYDAASRTINLNIEALDEEASTTFSYPLILTPSKRTQIDGKLWLHDVELGGSSSQEIVKTTVSIGVDLQVAGAESDLAPLPAAGGWSDLGTVSVYMPDNATSANALVVSTPIETAVSGPDVQFSLDLYKTTPLATDANGVITEQAATILSEVTSTFADPAYLEINLDQVADLQNIPAGEEPYVATFDETSQVWVKVPILEVDPVTNSVTVEAAHFSTWGAGLGSSLPQNGANVLLFDQPYTSLFTGAARYSVPVWLPKGRAGMQPDISLSYSSATVDGVLGDVQAPSVGVGWNMDAVEVVRKITTDQNGYGYRNEFALTLNGALYQLVRDEVSQNRYYTDQAAFLYVERHNYAFSNTPSTTNATGEWWEVVTTDGTRYRLGWNPDSEQLALMYGYSCTTNGQSCITPNGAYASLGYAGKATNLVAMRWRVDKVTDTHGNYMTYSYTETQPSGSLAAFDRESYLDTIVYTGFIDPEGTAPSLNPAYMVRFYYANRSTIGDVPVEFNVWDNVDTKLLSGINVCYQACPVNFADPVVRSYAFGYTLAAAPNANGTLMLTSLAIKGGGYTENGQVVPQVTAPTVRFGYQTMANRDVSATTNDPFNYPRLVTIENGSGGKLTYTYETDNRGFNSWYNYRVKNVVVDGGMGTAKKQGYAYASPVYSGLGGNASLGSLMGYTTVTESVLNFLASDAKILDTRHTFGTVGLDVGRELQTEWLDSSTGTVLRKTSNVYVTDNSQAPFLGWNYRYLGETSSYVLSSGTLIQTTKTTFFNDPATGNPLLQSTYLGNTLYRKTYYEYLPNTSPSVYILDKATRVLLVGANNQIYSDTRYHYDEQTGAVPTQGDLTLVQKLTGNAATPTETVDSYTHYDVYGNPISSGAFKNYGVVGANNVCPCLDASTTYDSVLNTYPIASTDPMGKTSTIDYLFTLGAPYQTTDPNQWTTKTTYDGLGRTLSVTPPGLGQAGTVYIYPMPTNGNLAAPHAVEMQILDTIAGKYRSVWGIYDGMGRMLQTQVDAGAGNLLLNTTQFNPQGLTEKQSLPYQVTGAGGNFVSNPGTQFTITAYDALGRPVQVTAPGNLISKTTYNGLTTTSLDPNGNKVMRTTDALGRMIAVSEYANTSTVYGITQYSYDNADRLITVTDTKSNATIGWGVN